MSENRTSYAGQVVIITGAARGIGAATARLVAERGGKVFAACRDWWKRAPRITMRVW